MKTFPHLGSMAKVLALSGAAVFTAACNSSGDDLISSSSGSAGGLPGCVALFVNGSYVDYNPGSVGSEAYNMEVLFGDAGVGEVRTFTGVTASDFSAAVAGCDALVIPENESGNLASVLTPAEHAVISNFVNGGGSLTVAWAGDSEVALVNDVFGWSVVATGVATPITLDAAAASGTTFDGGTTVGGTTLPSANATDAYLATSLPNGARAAYTDVNGEAVVFTVDVGAGRVSMLGYDYYDAAPFGSQDGGWYEVAVQSVLKVSSSPSK